MDKENRLYSIKYRLSLKKYLKRIDYCKIHFYSYVLNLFSVIIKILISIAAPGILVVFTILNISNILDIFSFIPKENGNILSNIAITLYGFQIAILAIVLSIKNKTIINTKENVLVLNYSLFGFTLRYLLVYTNIYLVLLIIDNALAFDLVMSSTILIVYCIMSIIIIFRILFLSSTKLYFYNNTISVSYLFLQKRGNFINFWSDFSESDFDDIYNHSKKATMSQLYYILSDIAKLTFYKSSIINDEIDLYKLIATKFIKLINNDSDLMMIHLFITQSNIILNNLYNNEKYDLYDSCLIALLNSLLKIFKSNKVSKRFATPNNELFCQMIVYDRILLNNIYIRNTLIINIVKKAYEELYDNIKEKTNFDKLYDKDANNELKLADEFNELIKKNESRNMEMDKKLDILKEIFKKNESE